MIFLSVVPKLVKGKYSFTEEYNAPVVMSCEVNRSKPLPFFLWKYQNLLQDCQGICKPDEKRWTGLPTGQTISPPSGQTNKSVVNIPKDQPSAFYMCVATNNVGSDSRTMTLLRRGEASLEIFPGRTFQFLLLFNHYKFSKSIESAPQESLHKTLTLQGTQD